MKRFVKTKTSLIALLLAISSAFFCGAARSEEPTGHKKAFLASVRDYEMYDAAVRDALDNDAKQLSNLLSARMGYEITLFDTSAATGKEDPQSAPRDSFEKKFNEWIGTLQEGDTAFVYLTGVGVLDQNGDVHFTFANYKQDEDALAVNLNKGAYPMTALRDLLDKSAASSKFLVLDCCHAGAIGKDSSLANAKDFLDVFKTPGSVTIFASSQGDELSQMWPEKKHSRFTFWLLYGLRGYADDNLDGEITLEELYRYVKQRIKGQTPQIIYESANESLTFSPRAVDLKKRREDEIAELLACEIKARNPNLKLGGPEFSFGYDNDEKISPEGGGFPKRLAKDLAKKYMDRAAEENLVGVIDFERVSEILAENEIEIGRLAARKVEEAFHKGASVDVAERTFALVKGQATLDRKSAVAKLSIACVDLEDGVEFGPIKCAALLDAQDLADLGHSFTIGDQNGDGGTAEAITATLVADYIEETGQAPNEDDMQDLQASAAGQATIIDSFTVEGTTHPLQTDDALCKVSFRTRQYVENADVNRSYENEGKIAFSDKVARFNLKPGEEFAIVIENTRNQDALVSVTVDGRDTNFDSSEGDVKDKRLGPRREDFKSNGLWLLRKAEDNKPLEIRGFTRRNENKYGSFRVVDLKTDENGNRTTYGDQTGHITIRVWDAAEVKRGGKGVEAGPDGKVELHTVEVKGVEFRAQYDILYDD